MDDPRNELAALDREALAWLMRFASAEATAADLDALRSWCRRDPKHAEAFARASRMWEGLGPAGRNLEAREFMRAARAGRRPASLGRRALLGGGLAASAMAGAFLVARPPLGLWPSFTELQADFRTGTAERKLVSPAEGVSVHLNARTSLVAEAEGVNLIAGEAVVMLAQPARLFAVAAGRGRTTASNASFDVRYVGGSVSVTGLSGNVQVAHHGGRIELKPSQQIFYTADAMSSIGTVDPEVVTAWRDGLLVFHGTPLAEVVEQVNRYRAGRVILIDQALGRRLFNARFRVESVDDVVEQIGKVFDARITTLPGGIVLVG